jgi:hypothetical protein
MKKAHAAAQSTEILLMKICNVLYIEHKLQNIPIIHQCDLPNLIWTIWCTIRGIHGSHNSKDINGGVIGLLQIMMNLHGRAEHQNNHLRRWLLKQVFNQVFTDRSFPLRFPSGDCYCQGLPIYRSRKH